LYPDAWMYRPKYFAPSIALHGSATDALVKTYPASHGCVRMLHHHVDRLWKNDIGIGYRVIVKGEWVAP
jgi:lipoprotein-anchoring transpeptidase ErfK/SrfK